MQRAACKAEGGALGFSGESPAIPRFYWPLLLLRLLLFFRVPAIIAADHVAGLRQDIFYLLFVFSTAAVALFLSSSFLISNSYAAS